MEEDSQRFKQEPEQTIEPKKERKAKGNVGRPRKAKSVEKNKVGRPRKARKVGRPRKSK